MSEYTIQANERTAIGKKVRAIRRQGMVPGVLYGHGVDGQPIQMDTKEAEQLLSDVSASTLIDLKVDGSEHKVLVRDVQRDVIKRNLMHIDFLKVAMDVAIRTTVPVELVGEAPAAHELGGILVTGVTEIEVEALPEDLPDRILVDLEPLKEIDDAISIADLYLGDGVTVLTDPSENVAHVIYMAEEEEEEEDELEGLFELGAEPELVDQRGVDEEEFEEAPAAPEPEEEE
ncbi:MAG: 50S ribosomal protein L25 [Anaerolineales bacterium]